MNTTTINALIALINEYGRNTTEVTTTEEQANAILALKAFIDEGHAGILGMTYECEKRLRKAVFEIID